MTKLLVKNKANVDVEDSVRPSYPLLVHALCCFVKTIFLVLCYFVNFCIGWSYSTDVCCQSWTVETSETVSGRWEG